MVIVRDENCAAKPYVRHLAKMKRFSPTAILVALAACSPEAKVPAVDICDIPERGERLIGKEIIVAGWYAGGGHMFEIGSDKCKDDTLIPRFKEGTVGVFQNPKDQWRDELNAELKVGVFPITEFYARFHGVLRFRAGSLHWNPRNGYYELEIDRVEGIRWEEAPFIERPPPCDAECQGYGRKMGATYP
ncbi:MAG TPA: hypothetical protein PKD99_01785 [Sphingopyxis sp.]|nr:hypothetical protein [Sphingopyxis sp.]